MRWVMRGLSEFAFSVVSCMSYISNYSSISVCGNFVLGVVSIFYFVSVFPVLFWQFGFFVVCCQFYFSVIDDFHSLPPLVPMCLRCSFPLLCWLVFAIHVCMCSFFLVSRQLLCMTLFGIFWLLKCLPAPMPVLPALKYVTYCLQLF